jgi:hypothetical protein
VLFANLASVAQPQLSKFNPQALGTLAWAFAKLDTHHVEFFRSLAEAAIGQLDGFTPQGAREAKN